MAMIQVPLSYLKRLPRYQFEKPFVLERDDPQDPIVTNIEQDLFHTTLIDLRGRESEFNCDKHGFQFITHQSAVNLAVPTFPNSIAYIKETVSLFEKEFQADLVICYNITRRGAKDSSTPMGPTHAVHVDQSIHGGFDRARRHLSDEEIAKYIDSGQWRIRIVNAWRPVKEIEASPLALCDYNTVKQDDLVETDLVGEDFVADVYRLHHNRGHRFYWLSKQKPTELCMFVVFDSLDTSTGHFSACAHTAFKNPYARADALPRESLEVRCIVFTKIDEPHK